MLVVLDMLRFCYNFILWLAFKFGPCAEQPYTPFCEAIAHLKRPIRRETDDINLVTALSSVSNFKARYYGTRNLGEDLINFSSDF